MAEGCVGTSPQVFVVDSQASYTMPSEKKPSWARGSQNLLLLLVGLVMLGLVVEGYFISNLYKKTEAFSICRSHPFCQNLTDSNNKGGVIMSQTGFQGSNEISNGLPHQEQIHQRPFAHLMGSSNPVGKMDVVQWVSEGGEAITHNMSYDKGRLLVEIEGYYYLYSKVQLNAAEDCSLIQHKVMKNTSAYDRSIELMKSKSFRCKTPKTASPKSSDAEDLWNSFLAGIFHLQSGDEIFVTLENIQKIRSGSTYNFMGAFMIFP
ncbi:Tumor necrosis factor ligand superfamily member 14 Herpes virus entry mediator ligand [Channa argus]|uniref:Tumor necrosis factor ligand superfamily member 14 Herpes virus entry mediator ligand n=1 Tax=Channa argus TaxID=215402 RepID=A0A6G1PAR7_CHAAH|nr:Tumor necrosis factor ligand superfamily member 14 Herpes virus entry mediator ligand [Channa argus]